MYERGKSDRPRSTCEPAEQGHGCGGGGGKAASQGEHGQQTASRTQCGQGRLVRWAVCVMLHDGTRMRGSPRCCTMSRQAARAAYWAISRRPHRGWMGDLGRLRAGLGGQPPGSARAGAVGALPANRAGGSTSRNPTVGKRPWDRLTGGQIVQRASSGAQTRVRGGLPGFLVWVSTGTWPA